MPSGARRRDAEEWSKDHRATGKQRAATERRRRKPLDHSKAQKVGFMDAEAESDAAHLGNDPQAANGSPDPNRHQAKLLIAINRNGRSP